MTATTAGQFCANGMTDKIFEYAEQCDQAKEILKSLKSDSKPMTFKKQQFLIVYNTHHMIIGAVKVNSMLNNNKSSQEIANEFVLTPMFESMLSEIVEFVTKNYSFLMQKLSSKQKDKFQKLFE